MTRAANATYGGKLPFTTSMVRTPNIGATGAFVDDLLHISDVQD